MKYLRGYKIFESPQWFYNDSIRAEMSDILCELEDNNYQVRVHKAGTTGGDVYLPIGPSDSINVWIGKGTTKDRTSGLRFTWNDIKPVIDQLQSYLSDRYYVSSTKAVFNGFEQVIDPKVVWLYDQHQFSTATITFHPVVK